MLTARADMVNRVNVAPASEPDLLLLRHHPDLRNRPEPRPGRVAQDTRAAALSWNVFRTLSLVSAPFWLRRLRARLVGLSSLDSPPQVLDVHLWASLASPGRPNGADAVRVDVLIDTDVAVYGLMVCDRTDLPIDDGTVPGADPILSVIDAVSWYAGVRGCYMGLVTSDPADAPVGSALIRRYASSRDLLLRRLSHRRDGLVNVSGIGSVTWRELASILRECAEAGGLDDGERFLARRTADWLAGLGIHPTA